MAGFAVKLLEWKSSICVFMPSRQWLCKVLKQCKNGFCILDSLKLYILLFDQLIVAEKSNDRIAEVESKC